MLRFTFDGQGEWESTNAAGWTYRVQVCEDGTFTVATSDRQLGLGNPACFDTFEEAVAFCELANQSEVVEV